MFCFGTRTRYTLDSGIYFDLHQRRQQCRKTCSKYVCTCYVYISHAAAIYCCTATAVPPVLHFVRSNSKQERSAVPQTLDSKQSVTAVWSKDPQKNMPKHVNCNLYSALSYVCSVRLSTPYSLYVTLYCWSTWCAVLHAVLYEYHIISKVLVRSTDVYHITTTGKNKKYDTSTSTADTTSMYPCTCVRRKYWHIYDILYTSIRIHLCIYRLSAP